MQMTWRPIKIEDLKKCSRLPLEDEYAYDPKTRACLPALWHELLTGGFAETALMEDWDLPTDQRLVGFAFVVFLTDAFVADAKACPTPYINRRIVEAWLAGKSPILKTEAVRAANSGAGLNQHTFHEAFPNLFPTPPPQTLEITIDMYFKLSAGYKIKEATIEVYGPHQLQMNLNGGFRLRNDYGGYYDGSRPIPTRGQPFLIGMNREESQSDPGSTVSLIFNHRPPRFFFRPGEQDLLQRALWGETDEEIAESLFLSVTAVRKRWLAIYERVGRVNPNLFPLSPETDSPVKSRGLEKRRVLLSYLRSHWEELRPIQSRP